MYYLWIYDALVKINAGGRVGAHHEAPGADAGVTAGRIDTLAAAARIPLRAALINVLAAPAVQPQHVAGVATAAVGARRVDAQVITASVAIGALINIFTGESSADLSIALVTDALVAPHHVLTDSVGTNAACPAAFVHVFAVPAITCQLVAGWALALVGPGRVDASALLAQTLVSLAFIDVHADLHHGRHLEPGLTVASKAAFGIDAGPVTTDPVHDAALVNVHTLDPVFIQRVALVAPTPKRSDRILTSAILTHARE